MWKVYSVGLGFIQDITTGSPIPSSMFDISAVSINEQFSPLIGVDVTLLNNMTLKLPQHPKCQHPSHQWQQGRLFLLAYAHAQRLLRPSDQHPRRVRLLVDFV